MARDEQEQGGGMDEQMMGAIIESLAAQMSAYYVVPEVGAAMADTVMGKWKLGEYAGVESPAAFAKRLTDELRAVSHDLHVRVYVSDGRLPVAELDEAGQPIGRAPAWVGADSLNFGFAKVERLAGNVGYLKMDACMPTDLGAETLHGAMAFLAHTGAMILDLRENRGGDPGMVQLLCSYFFEQEPVLLNTIYSRRTGTTREYWSVSDLPGKRYVQKPVFVLTSGVTFSGAEEITYNLQQLKRATIVGEVTRGGANPGALYRLHDHFEVFIPTERSINPITKTNWEGTGVAPDVPLQADEALAWAYRQALKHLGDELEADPRKYPNERYRQELRRTIDELGLLGL